MSVAIASNPVLHEQIVSQVAAGLARVKAHHGANPGASP
jgi:hypothetical protein